MRRRFRRTIIPFGILPGMLSGSLIVWTVVSAAFAQPPAPKPGAATDAAAPVDPDDILSMDIDQLSKVDVLAPALDMEVTTVSRQESTVGRTPAAVFVITSEMIRRSGARSIPEVLRMAPGVEVARISASTYSVSCRGFNSRYSNKLLVQIDGRSVYSPVFGGVFWESTDVMLEDVERIEVVRGPGATVWGSNAVNGVINIITKEAKDTQGLMFTGGAGGEERGFTNLRYGGKSGKNLYWRVYGKQFDRDEGYLPGDVAHDDYRMAQAGFRMDWKPNCCDTITFQGDFYNGDQGVMYHQVFEAPPSIKTIVGDRQLSGGNVLGRWARDLGCGESWVVQMYYNRWKRTSEPLDLADDTIDIDFQHNIPIGRRHNLIWGAGYRNWRCESRGTFSISFDPSLKKTDLFSYFVQDEITLREDLLKMTIGSKFEHNSYTGFEIQPGIRFLWTPDNRRSAWASVSRAVRIPTEFEEDMRVAMVPPPPVFVMVTGNKSLQSEDLLAWEMGYRAQPVDRFYWDLALFFNQYENLISFVPGPFSAPTWYWTPLNAAKAETYGFELTSTLEINDCWKLTGSYSYLQMYLHSYGGMPSEAENPEMESPSNQVYLRSSWDLAYDMQFDLMLRYVDAIKISSMEIPSYVTMDFRWAWRASRNLELSVVGQNLLNDHHFESYSDSGIATAVDRSAYGMVSWRY